MALPSTAPCAAVLALCLSLAACATGSAIGESEPAPSSSASTGAAGDTGTSSSVDHGGASSSSQSSTATGAGGVGGASTTSSPGLGGAGGAPSSSSSSSTSSAASSSSSSSSSTSSSSSSSNSSTSSTSSSSSGGGPLESVVFVGNVATAMVGEPGTPTSNACPAGQALGGLEVRYDSTVNGIRPYCGIPSLIGSDPYDVKVSAGATFPNWRGPAFDSSGNATCLPDQVLVGVSGVFSSKLDKLIVHCAPLIASESGGVLSIGVGPVATTPPIGGGSAPTFEILCPAGSVAVALRTRHYDFVDAIGLTCATPTLAP